MQARGQQRQPSVREEECAQHKAQFVSLATESRSVLFELGCILNQRYRNRGPNAQTQRSLQRKNTVINRLDQFITEQQSAQENEARSREQEENDQATIERLQKQLQDQNLAFEVERTRLQQQATLRLNAQAELNASLNRVLLQVRGVLDTHDREQGQHTQDSSSTRTVTITGQSSTQGLTKRLKDLQSAFNEERAHLLKQASDAANTQLDISRRNLTEREAALTCPISLDLFENPILTTCCGKTFSSGALMQALRQNHQCPVCRSFGVSTHSNRDMANLVELHKTERSVLGVPEAAAAYATAVVPGTNDSSVAEQASNVNTNQQTIDTSSDVRQNRNRDQRNQRIQARSAVPHRQPSRITAPPATSTPLSTNQSARGRRRGGRGSRYRSSRSPAAARTTGSGLSENSQSQTWGSTASSYSNQGSALNYFFPSSSSANNAPVPSSSSIRYGRAPTDDEFNFYPYADIGYYGSDSDY